jgi:hypothetical protein
MSTPPGCDRLEALLILFSYFFFDGTRSAPAI